MTPARRRVLKTLALAGAFSPPAGAQESDISLDALRAVSKFQGTNFPDDRLQVVKPVLEHRRPQVRALRDFELDDTVAPG